MTTQIKQRAWRPLLSLGILIGSCCLSAAPERTEGFQPPADALVVGLRETATHRDEPAAIPIAHYSGMMDGAELWLHVDAEGRVTEIQPGIGTTAAQLATIRKAALQIHYRPFLKNGQAAQAWVQATMRFRSMEDIPVKVVPFPKISTASNFSIQLIRTACFGSCPAYSVTVRGDGLVSYEGDGWVSIQGKQTAHIPPEKAAELLARFKAANFLALQSSYRAGVTDNPTYQLTLKLPGITKRVTKRVTDYVGEWVGMPAVVTELEEAVDRTADSARWVSANAGTMEAIKAAGIGIPSQKALLILQTAVSIGDLDTAGSLLAVPGVLHPANNYGVSSRDVYGRSRGGSLLEQAVGTRRDDNRPEKSLEMVKLLLTIPEIRADQASKQSALGRAAESGQVEIARLLIGAGADPTVRFVGNNDGQSSTYLTLAAASGVWAMLDDALARPHDIHATDRTADAGGHTALQSMVWNAPQHEDIFPLVDKLLAAGAGKDELDRVLLDTCQPKWIPGLVARGGNVNARDADGSTPLFHSCTVEGVQALLEAGADPSLRNHDGKTAEWPGRSAGEGDSYVSRKPSAGQITGNHALRAGFTIDCRASFSEQRSSKGS